MDVSGVQGRQTSAQDAMHMAVTNWFLFLLQVLLLLVPVWTARRIDVSEIEFRSG